MTFEEDTVGVLVHGAGKGIPPSVGDITGETWVWGLLRSGGVMKWAVFNSSPELRENVGAWGGRVKVWESAMRGIKSAEVNGIAQ